MALQMERIERMDGLSNSIPNNSLSENSQYTPKSGNTSGNHPKPNHNFQNLMPFELKIFNSNSVANRRRGQSHDEELISKNKKLIMSSMLGQEELWKDIKFDNEEDRISKFID